MDTNEGISAGKKNQKLYKQKGFSNPSCSMREIAFSATSRHLGNKIYKNTARMQVPEYSNEVSYEI